MSLESGHLVVPITDEEKADQDKNFLSFEKIGLVRIQPGNWFLLKSFVPFLDKVYNFKFKSTDVIVVTYPKCGTTWTQEIVWTMRNNPDLDNPKAEIGINNRCPFLEADGIFEYSTIKSLMGEDSEIIKEFKTFFPNDDPNDGIMIKLAETIPDPRTYKTHLPFSLLQKDILERCKVVYVVRNPKDVVTSFLHHSRLMKNQNYVGTQDKFVDYFVNDDLNYSPYGLHLKEAVERKNEKNMHLIFFEDMKADHKKVIKELNEFLETDLTEKQIENVVHHTSFAEMKKRDNAADDMHLFFNEEYLKKEGGFFREGKSGNWKAKLDDSQVEKMEKWMQNNLPDELKSRYIQ